MVLEFEISGFLFPAIRTAQFGDERLAAIAAIHVGPQGSVTRVGRLGVQGIFIGRRRVTCSAVGCNNRVLRGLVLLDAKRCWILGF